MTVTELTWTAAGIVAGAAFAAMAGVLGWILALSDGAWAAVDVLITGFGAVGVALVNGRASRLAAHETAKRIGTPSEHGSVMETLESVLRGQATLLEGQAGQDKRLASIESVQVEQAVRMTSIESTQQTFCASVHGIEVALTDGD